MDKIPVTATGFTHLEKELKNLKSVERPDVVKAIAEAREHGDLKENAEYHAARERQSFIEGRILELEAVVSRADVIDPSSMSGDTIKFGATIDLIDEETEDEVTYQIVGEYEADLENGKISMTAPIARALIGKSEGDSAEVKTPKGVRYYEVVAIRYI
ncbi:MAG: transcription elongation factor GreA [Rickettsiales bacterium]|nr:transcription elongation factor GreA [Rickettsiales bacterium]